MRRGVACGVLAQVLLLATGLAWGQAAVEAPAGTAAEDGTRTAGTAQAAPDAATASAAEGKGGATVSFGFERPGLAVPHFVLTVREDGSGRYLADEAAGAGSAGQHVDRPVQMTQATMARIFAVARAQHNFNVPCESKIKNLANTGRKTLTYAGPDGAGSCVYNYSEIKDVQSLTDTFLATAFTLDEGRRLEFKKRFDRLGLDAEISALAHAAEAKQAVELGTISAVLTGIANDTELMERVRLRAAKLLELGKEAQ